MEIATLYVIDSIVLVCWIKNKIILLISYQNEKLMFATNSKLINLNLLIKNPLSEMETT